VSGELLLAIDTSGMTASVAVFQDQVLAETAWHSGRRHSAELLPVIDQTMRLASTDKKSLTAVAVAAGPGSYSGLRVGVSTAMAMALALDIGVVQVPTLDVIAWGAAATEHVDSRNSRAIRAAIDVGRGHFATCRFRRGGQGLEHETRIESVGLGELMELAASEHSLLVVDLDPEAREQVQRHVNARCDLAPPSAALRRAGFLGELAAMKIRRGELASASVVEPIYLHS
jgi:tRNA threonylcarbamoyladenosine biosynthesis protein TsaB